MRILSGLIFWSMWHVCTVNAAPIPATSSSILISEYPGLFRSSYGFLIHTGKTNWLHTEAPGEIPSIVTVYRSPQTHQGVQAALTVRVDELKADLNLKTYAKKWMKDYHRLGFDVLASKPVQVQNQTGFLVDVLNRESNKQLRQVIFMRNKTAVVLSCRDHRENFNETVNACNEIIRSFKWNLDAQNSNPSLN